MTFVGWMLVREVSREGKALTQILLNGYNWRSVFWVELREFRRKYDSVMGRRWSKVILDWNGGYLGSMEMRWRKGESFHTFCGSQGNNTTQSSFCFRQLCLGGLERRVSLETYNLGQRGQLFTSKYKFVYTHCCCCSVTKLCPTLCHPMNCSMPGLPVSHYLPEFAQVHVYWIGNAIQQSHPLQPSSPFAFCLSQHQGLFQWLGSSQQVAKVLEFHHHPKL